MLWKVLVVICFGLVSAVSANRLNADSLGDVIERLEKRGYQFISLDEALRDAAYLTPDEFVGPMGPLVAPSLDLE